MVKKIATVAAIYTIFIFFNNVKFNNVIAHETDPFMIGDLELKDSADLLNNFINHQIKKVISSANRRHFSFGNSCNSITNRISFRLLPIEFFNLRKLDRYPNFSIFSPYFRHISIYKNLPRHKIVIMAPTIRIGDNYVSSDKLSHFVSLGRVYRNTFKKYYKIFIQEIMVEEEAYKQASKKAVLFGVRSEKTILGYRGTGVFSFADLEANYQGMRLLLNLCEGDNPHLKIVDNRWTLVRDVDVREYVNPDWDESFNVCSYAPNTWEKVKNELIKYCGFKRNYLPFAPSFSSTFIEELKQNKMIPDPENGFSFKSICKEFHKN